MWCIISVYVKNAKVNFGEKISAKSENSIRIKMGALFAINATIYALQEG